MNKTIVLLLIIVLLLSLSVSVIENCEGDPPSPPSPSENVPPVADAGGPYSGYVNETITFTGSGSNDSDGIIVNYTWNFGDGTVGYGVNTTHIYTMAAVHNVTLNVIDDDGSTDNDTATVNVTERGVPLFDVLLELISDSVYEGENITALITLINVGEPGLVNGTAIYTIYRGEVVVWSDEENVSVLGQKAYNKTISTVGLSVGEYIYEVVYSYGDDQTASSSNTFTVKIEDIQEENSFPYTPSTSNPTSGLTNVSINADLYWVGGDPDPSDTITYDIYFGNGSPPPKIVNNQSGTTYDPGTMNHTTTYYWKIVAFDDHGNSVVSPIWYFTTEEERETTPGFELIFGLCAIVFVLLCKRYWKRKNE